MHRVENEIPYINLLRGKDLISMKEFKELMPTQLDLEEEISLLSVICIVVAGINIIWAIFLLPWGFFGYASALIDVILFFTTLKIKNLYLTRNYKDARNKAHYFIIIGFIFGLIIIGIVAYRIYREIDDIVLRSHLVRGRTEVIYASPRFPS